MKLIVSQFSSPLEWLAHKLEAVITSWSVSHGQTYIDHCATAETDELTLAALVGPVPF